MMMDYDSRSQEYFAGKWDLGFENFEQAQTVLCNKYFAKTAVEKERFF